MKNPAPYVFLGIPFHNVSFADTIEWVIGRIRDREPGYIATANLDFLMQAWRDPELQRILIDADLVIADGMPIVLLSRFFGPRLKERVTGSDLVPMISEHLAKHEMSIFALGAAPGVAPRAAETLRQRNPGLRIAGAYSPPKADILDMNNTEILDLVSESDPDLLLVAFGAPKQEKWINMHFKRWRVPVAIGIGGTLDFIAGAQRRAPKFFQFVGLEWLFRMLSNPKRLVKRYVANMLFLLRAVGETIWIRCTASAKLGGIIDADEKELAKLGAELLPAEAVLRSEDDDSIANDFAPRARGLSLVVDLRSTGWLDSAELGRILRLSRICMRNENRLYLVNVSKRLRRFLTMTHLQEYLPICRDWGELSARLEATLKSKAHGLRIHSDSLATRILLPREINAANSEEIRGQLDDFWRDADATQTDLSIDASQLDFIDSAGLGLLVETSEAARTRGMKIAWSGFHGKALRTIKISRLDRIIVLE